MLYICIKQYNLPAKKQPWLYTHIKTIIHCQCLVYRIEVAGLPYQSRRFTVSKSPVCRVEITGLACQSRRFVVSKSPVYRVEIATSFCCIEVTGLPCQNYRFVVSKSPSHRFAVSKLPAKMK